MALIPNGRRTVYTNQVPYESDILTTGQYKMVDISWLAQVVLETGLVNPKFVAALPCAPITPPGMQVTVGSGAMYQFEPLEPTAWSVLPQDLAPEHDLFKQALNMAIQTFNTPAPVTPGDSVYYLIECQFQTVDENPVNRPYFNSADPTMPIFTVQSDTRQDLIVFQIITGAPGVAPVPPSASVGYTPLYNILVANGQTSIISGNITVAAGAPFITESLTQKISQATADTLYKPLSVKYSQVSFGASSTQNITPPGVDVKVLFDNVITDTFSWWDGTNYRFVPTIAGKFRITSMVYQPGTPNPEAKRLKLYKNGIFVRLLNDFGTEFDSTLNGSVIQTANGSTDYFEIYFQSDVYSLNIGANGPTTGTTFNLFEIEWLGS